jgi:hypothetical protein
MSGRSHQGYVDEPEMMMQLASELVSGKNQANAGAHNAALPVPL